MKKVFLTAAMVAAGLSAKAQSFKSEQSMIDGQMFTSYTLFKYDKLQGQNGANLYAIASEEDTAYFFSFKDMQYQRIVEFESTNVFSADQIRDIFKAAELVRGKELKFASVHGVTISRSLGALKFSIGNSYNWLYLDLTQNRFNEFING